MEPSLHYLPGDIILTRSRSWLGRAIRRLTRSRGESDTQVNHVGIIVSHSNYMNRCEIVEALMTVKHHRIDEQYSSGHSDIAIFRPVTLTQSEVAEVVSKARSYVGRKYGPIKLVLHLLDWCIGDRYIFRRLGRLDRFPICSYLVAQSFASIKKDFGVHERAASPDDIWDFVTTSKHYIEIRPLSPYPWTAP